MARKLESIFSPGDDWSRWVYLANGGVLIETTGAALRGRIKRYREVNGNQDEFELVPRAIQIKRLGGRWLMRLHRSWLSPRGPVPPGAPSAPALGT
jgi:hypothetical protein